MNLIGYIYLMHLLGIRVRILIASLPALMSCTQNSTIFIMGHLPPQGSMRGELHLDFNSDSVFCGLTVLDATQLVAHLPLTIDRVIIANAKHGVEFMEALIERVKELHNLKELMIEKTLVGGEEEGRGIGLQLA